ncbi:PEP/pyruvate-binding domain-containing protein [bacterium RCC_150]
MAMVYTQRFEEISGGDVATAGGKGSNLGELTRAGLPVPPGFVILTDAYKAFLEANELTSTVVEIARRTTAVPSPAYTGDAVPSGDAAQSGSAVQTSTADVDRLAPFDAAEREIHALFRSGTIPADMFQEIHQALRDLHVADGATFAVRSSATAEDLADASFAGQQETYLNVRPEGLETAVKDCWASLWTARAMAYRSRRGIDPAGVSLAVVVETMIESEASGVMFTANPGTGRRDEIMVSAAWGLGESVVSGAVSTDDYVVDKTSWTPKSQFVADKAVMTVYSAQPDGDSGTIQRPVPDSRRRATVLNEGQLKDLARLGARIEEHFGTPQDIEWAMSGGEVHVVQSRPITALPEPSADAPTEWTLPYPHGLYFRASIVEQLPDPLSPLFADLIDGSVTKSITKLLAAAFHGDAVREGDIALPTVNGYAYYYYKNSGMLRLMAKSPGAMLALARGSANMGVEGWRGYSHPLYAKLVEEWSAKPVANLSNAELFDGVTQLLDGGTVYYTAVQSIIPMAATSEIVFAWFYDKFVRRPGDPLARTFLLGFDSEPIRAEKSLYELAAWTRERPQLAEAILNAPAETLAAELASEAPGTAPSGVDSEQWREWSERFRDHLDRFGHAVFNLDFLSPVAADNPAPLLSTLKFYLRGEGNDPYERQGQAAERREEQTRIILDRLDPVRRAAFTPLLKWAQSTAPVREDALADIGLAWPLLRRFLRELGRRLSVAGMIEDPDDIFWLRSSELKEAIASPGVVPDGLEGGSTAPEQQVHGQQVRVHARLADAVEQRKFIWRGQRKANPPQLLPEITWLNRAFNGMMPANSSEQTGDTIKGVGASAGTVTATARVLGGPEDFGRMQPGDVLVARMTTPAWTSLFAMASAVVTDVGGPLSHSSIVAREYGIPAVLGTGVATTRIRSGQLVKVDGETGIVTLHNDAPAPSSGDGAAPEAKARPSTKARTAVGLVAGAAVLWGLGAAVRRRRRG